MKFLAALFVLFTVLQNGCTTSSFDHNLYYGHKFPQPFHHAHHNVSNQQELSTSNYYRYPADRAYYNQFLTGQTGRVQIRERSNENYQNEGRSDVYKKPVTTGIFKTYGRGRAQVTRKGDTVVAPNTLGRKSAYKATITARVTDGTNEPNFNTEGRLCKECPEDHTVVATKGKTFVVLPEPCDSTTWNPVSGPKPGSKIREGVHVIRGILIPRNKYCQYQYQVVVRRCDPLKAKEEDTNIRCTENNVWGSQCTVECGPEKEALGPTVLECVDDLKWSNLVPVCKSKMDCSTPKVKSNSKVFCQTANMTDVEGDFIPNGSVCRFKKNGKIVSINCKDGTWRAARKNKGRMQKKYMLKHKNEPEKINDPCTPNPCKNGGTCLASHSNKSPPICMCRPQTQGTQCEIVHCDYNFCYNEGLCILDNQVETCYCHPEYRGDRCQYENNRYTSQ